MARICLQTYQVSRWTASGLRQTPPTSANFVLRSSAKNAIELTIKIMALKCGHLYNHIP